MHDDDDDDNGDLDWDYIFPSDNIRTLLLAITALFVTVTLLVTGAYIGVVYVRHMQENIHRGTPP